MSEHADVGTFHSKFGVDKDHPPAPRVLTPDVFAFRLGFMLEELAEYAEASGYKALAGRIGLLKSSVKHWVEVEQLELDFGPIPMNLVKAVDALLDLSYVLHGTAHLMGVDEHKWDECWAAVQRANMAKVRVAGAEDPRSKRAHRLDVVKPDGWQAPEPDIAAALGLESLG